MSNILLLTAILIAGLTGPIGAATLRIDAGSLVGADDVDVEGVLYDVTFSNLTCAELYNGCDEASDFAFFDLDIARAAGRALFDQVLLDSPLGNFDTEPEAIEGCEFAAICFIQTPWALPITNGFSLGTFSTNNNVRVQSIGQNDTVSFGGLNQNLDSITTTRAVWTLAAVSGTPVDPIDPTDPSGPPAITPVPLPASGFLVLSGLLSLAVIRKKRYA